MIKKKKQTGIALITALAFATIVLIITATIYSRMTLAAKQITLRDKFDQQNALTDATLSNIIDWMNKKNYDKSAAEPNININKTAISFIADIYKGSKENFKVDPNEDYSANKPQMTIVAADNAVIATDLND